MILFYFKAAGGWRVLEGDVIKNRFVKGVQALPETIADEVRDRLRFNAPVRKIDQSGEDKTSKAAPVRYTPVNLANEAVS